MIAMLLVLGAVIVALHLKYPAAREASRDIGTNLVLGIFGLGIVLRSWRERRTDMPSAVAWLVIWSYAVVCTGVAMVMPHRVIPWYVSLLAVRIVLQFVVAVGTRPQSIRSE